MHEVKTIYNRAMHRLTVRSRKK